MEIGLSRRRADQCRQIAKPRLITSHNIFWLLRRTVNVLGKAPIADGMTALLILQPLVVVPKLHPREPAQAVEMVQALKCAQVAKEAKVGLEQGVVLHEPYLAPWFMVAPHVAPVTLPQIHADCLQTYCLGQPCERLGLAGNVLAMLVGLVRQVLGADPEELNVLQALQLGADSLREATLFAERGEDEAVLAVKECAAPEMPLGGDEQRCKQAVWLGGIRETDCFCANMKPV